jgi:hypothetical protein
MVGYRVRNAMLVARLREQTISRNWSQVPAHTAQAMPSLQSGHEASYTPQIRRLRRLIVEKEDKKSSFLRADRVAEREEKPG